MGEKSFVTMEQKVCVVCGQSFDTGSLLLDTRMRERFEMFTATGWGICPEDDEKYEKGYIALVGVDLKRSKTLPDDGLTQDGAYRTGCIAHLRGGLFETVMGMPLPMVEDKMRPMVFVNQEVIEKLERVQAHG